MAGDWIKLEHTTPDKQEVFAIAETLGIDPDAVVGKLVRVWVWADQQTYDGNAASVTGLLLDRITGVSGFADALVECGWCKRKNGKFEFANFARHNGKTAKTRANTQKRVQQHRNAASVTTALPEKRREEKSNTHTHKAEGFEEAWGRWCEFRLSVDGRELDGVRADAELMELSRRPPDKAIRDIDFSIRCNAKRILDSDNDFQKRQSGKSKKELGF